MQTFLIKKPIITEKATILANTQNTYVFEVDYSATKGQIKETIEQLYQVKVTQVNLLISASRRKRSNRKRQAKLQPSIKKAMVRLKEGQTIPLFDVGGKS